MKTKAIITSCSDKFFPSIINLLTSIKTNYPDHPPIYVYDLGLSSIFRYELERIEGVELIAMPHFCPHWRSCYTWKTYIFANPKADLNFYIDAGCQVLRPLEPDFEIIEKNDLLLIDISCKFDDIVPQEYRSIFGIKDFYNLHPTMSAGIIGFKKTQKVSDMFQAIYEAALVGLALGFSPSNAWRNKGKDKNPFVRSCALFRHDQTLLNLFYRVHFGDTVPFQSHDNYSGYKTNSPSQRILHLRLSWKFLEYTDVMSLHKKKSFVFSINRMVILFVSIMRQFNLMIKKSLGRL